MVFDILISFIHKIFVFILGLVPDISLPDKFLYYLDLFVQSLYKLDGWLPIKDIMYVFGIVIGFRITYFSIKFIISVINWIRGSGEIKIVS